MRRWLGACVAAALAGTPAAAAAPAPAEPASAAQRAGFRDQFERGLALSPGAPIFASIKANFPDDYAAMLDELVQGALQRVGDAAALRQLGFEASRKLFLRKLPDIVNAPAATLIELNRRQLAFVRNLSDEDPRACAEYVMTGFRAQTRLSPGREKEGAAIGAYMFEAARAGADRPRDSSRTGLDPQAAATWYAKLLELEPSPEVRAMLLDADLQAKGTPEQQCRMGIAIYGAIAAVPQEEGARISAFLLSESAATLGR